MKENQHRILRLTGRVTGILMLFGVNAACYGIYVSGLILKNWLSVGVGFMAASMFIFGCGLILALLEEITGSTPDPERPEILPGNDINAYANQRT